MKNALIIALAIFALSAIIFGISEKQGKDVYRVENNRLRDELKELMKRAASARVEANKFKAIADRATADCEERIQEASRKRK